MDPDKLASDQQFSSFMLTSICYPVYSHVNNSAVTQVSMWHLT